MNVFNKIIIGFYLTSRIPKLMEKANWLSAIQCNKRIHDISKVAVGSFTELSVEWLKGKREKLDKSHKLIIEEMA